MKTSEEYTCPDGTTREQLRAEWIAALRSGEFKQGEHRLESIDNGNSSYCCLGVACVVAGRHGVHVEKYREGDDSVRVGNRRVGQLTGLYLENQPEVLKAFWLNKAGGHPARYSNGRDKQLTVLNDTGHSFKDIADALESGDYWLENAGPGVD